MLFRSVSQSRYGTSYEYKALIREEDYKKKFLSNVVKNYFENSYKDLVSYFAAEKKISAEELQEIIRLIEKNPQSTKV